LKRSFKSKHCNLTRKFEFPWKCKFSSDTLFLKGSQKNFFFSKKIRQMKAIRNNKCWPLHLQIELCSPLHCLSDCSWPFYIKLVSTYWWKYVYCYICTCVFQAQNFCLVAIFWACFSSFFSLLLFAEIRILHFRSTRDSDQIFTKIFEEILFQKWSNFVYFEFVAITWR
jgi:hypothetical protein